MPDLVSSQARFGPFTFDVRTGELLKGGIRIKVPDQSIEVLRTLLERSFASILHCRRKPGESRHILCTTDV